MRRISTVILSLAFASALSSASPAAAGPGDPFNGIDVSVSIEWANGSSTTQVQVGDTIDGTILMGIPASGISFYSISTMVDSGLSVLSFDDTPPSPFNDLGPATTTIDGFGNTTISSFEGQAGVGPTSIFVAIGSVSFAATGVGNFDVTPFLAVGDGLFDNMLIDKSTGSAFTAASVTVVPEPTVALLMAMGLGVLSLHARNQRG